MGSSIISQQSAGVLAMALGSLALALALALACRWMARRLFPASAARVTCDAPGPPSWPLVGSHFSVELPLWRWVEREGKTRYGNVIQVAFPDHLAVIVSGYSEIREVFLNESLLGRPQLPWRKQVGAGTGLAMSEGKLWRAHRTFSIRALNDFGWGRPAGQSDIAEETRQIVQEIRDRLGPPAGGSSRSAELDVSDLVTQGVSAVISRMIFGCEQVAYDERFYSKLPLIQSFDRENRRSLGRALLRRLAKLWPARRAPASASPVLEALRMCQDQIDKRRRSLRAPRPGLARQNSGGGGGGGGTTSSGGGGAKDYADYIEFYLREKANYFSDDESDAAGTPGPPAGAAATPCLRDGRLAMTIFDLMTGGIDAVANLVRWALLLAAVYPEAQDRVRAEIVEAELAGDGEVAFADKERLPYTEAFLEEVQRFVSLMPEGVIRRAVADTTIGGFRIPRGTRIIPNLYGVHHDPEHFPEPQKFAPDRFLRGGQFQASRYLLPFSLGKRACPGEALARMESFALLMGLLRRFSVALPAPEAARLGDILRGADGFVRRAAEHRLLFTELPQPARVPPECAPDTRE